MKSKEWIALLIPLARAAETHSDDYLEAVERLFQESRAIIDGRLANIRERTPGFSGGRAGDQALGTGGRRLAAYREGLVKWDAVVHGVTLALDSKPPFPLFKGGALVHDLSQLHEQIQKKALPLDKAKSRFAELSRFIEALHYNEEKVFVALLDMTQEALNTGTLHQVEQAADALGELMDLIRTGSGESERAMELRVRAYHLRNQLLENIESLPIRDQLVAYHLLGQRVASPGPAAP